MTFIVENHHYYAWCRDCPYTGPLRFSRALAVGDAVAHRTAKHDASDDIDAAIGAPTPADVAIGAAAKDEVAQAIARQKPLPARDWIAEAKAQPTSEHVRNKWREAKAKGASDELLDEIAIIGVELAARRNGAAS